MRVKAPGKPGSVQWISVPKGKMMNEPLNVLIVEDSDYDARLLLNELKRGGYDPLYERVETREAMENALERQEWDLVIADYVMPCFSGLDALKIVQDRKLDLPFIIVSGNTASSFFKLRRWRLSVRLPPASPTRSITA